jgi:AcrR family transcriptional regulator
MTEAGLRERKKQKTRCALIESAFALFKCKGFEATTIDEIADAVDISPRTFFRYFGSKEEVALSLVDQQIAEMMRQLESRPPHEPVLVALRHAVVDVIRAGEDGTHGFDPTQVECMQVLMSSSPALVGRVLEQGAAHLAEIARLIGNRMGVSYLADPRPYLVASVALCAVQTVINAWREADPTAKASDLMEKAFVLLAEGLNYPSGALV